MIHHSRDIIGNVGPIDTLKQFIVKWKDGPPPIRGLLVTGPPGIGKTLAANLLAHENGYNLIAFNASIERTRSAVQECLKPLVTNKPISSSRPNLLLVDEVDGLEGGGLSELVQCIKTTQVPVICIANDRYAVKALERVCQQCIFARPSPSVILPKLAVMFPHIHALQLKEVLEASQVDMRQVMLRLQFPLGNQTSRADQTLKPFDACGRLLLAKDKSTMDKQLDLFYADSSLMPLYIHENYIRGQPTYGSMADRFSHLAMAADSVSCGDLLNTCMQKQQMWELMDSTGVISTIRPCQLLKGHFYSGSKMEFPSLLGKISQQNKFRREAIELNHMIYKQTVGASARAITMDYAPTLRTILSTENGARIADYYDLADQDMTIELCAFPGVSPQIPRQAKRKRDVLEKLPKAKRGKK